jgi:hypothetical protein
MNIPSLKTMVELKLIDAQGTSIPTTSFDQFETSTLMSREHHRMPMYVDPLASGARNIAREYGLLYVAR